MANQISRAPHLTNTHTGRERWDPMHSSIFGVIFTVPFVLRGEYNTEELRILSEQIYSIDGLDNINKTVGLYTQKYLGTDVAFFDPKVNNTTIDFNVTFNLNIRNGNDAFVYKLFKEWFSLMYDLSTGVRAIKDMVCAENMTILEANRDGTVWRQIVMHNVFVTAISGMNSLDYTSSESDKHRVTFSAVYWQTKLNHLDLELDT